MSQKQNPERLTASERRRQGVKATANPFMTRSAAQRRADKAAREGRLVTPGVPQPRAKEDARGISQERVAQLLDAPTRTVTEAELRAKYSYVLTDLRSMGLLSAALVVTLIALALILP
jgi:hypothetical protein